VIFFARPEVLSGLFTLANYDRSDPNGVICPMGAECSSIILYPVLEGQKQEDEPKVVLGIFDPTARPCLPLDVLSMAFPMKRFEKAWSRVQKKIEQSAALYRKG